MKTIEEFTRATYKNDNFIIRPRIVCNDGFTMSAQASSGHYCSPRKPQHEYFSMEIGYPSIEEPLIAEYAEDKDSLTETVYGYVPCNIINEVIEKHGGINEAKTFKK